MINAMEKLSQLPTMPNSRYCRSDIVGDIGVVRT
jgi:hypothetical protein